MEHLAAELQRLDLLLHREILRLRANYQLSLDEFRGLYISDEQVNQLINRSLDYEGPTSVMDELTAQAESLRAFACSRGCPDSPWQKLVTEFSLSSIERDILLLAVAREVDLKYETLLAYLNNDITRKWPTFDVAMRVCAATAEDRLDVRRCLQPQANLFGSGLLQPIASTTDGRSWLATGFSVAPVVPHYLSGTPCLDARLTPFVEERKTCVEWERLPVSSDLLNTLRRLPHLFANASSGGPIVILSGRNGSGRGLAAEAVCYELGLSLLRVDLEALRASGENVGRLTQALLLQQRLQAAGLLLTRCEALSDKEARPFPESQALLKMLAGARSPLFIACDSATALRELLPNQRTLSFHFDDPQYATRLHLWEVALAPVSAKMTRADLEALADRFALTPGQIAATVSSAVDAQAIANPGKCESVNVDALFAAARVQSDQSLGNLAVKVKMMPTWEDLVLPRVTLQRMREVTAAIHHRHIVYSDWGFEKRIAAGKGLKVLLSGGSGTGKTMTASVVARELGLDLYKIDLSSLVSKYIGETEKNLDRIFRSAQCSNAILFFDEADALFGKRSETKDAHDRYANIEVAYLLQKIEEYDGVVILASNLSKNIDEAFSRRMHYVVEFPLPDESHREKLWRGMFPPEVPLGEDVNFQFLAKQFQLAGGDIRNVALDAAFLAAQDGKVITMKQLVMAMSRQMIKQGRIPSPTDFKQYHALIGQGD
ncbi:MAG: ATP-binding protein [Deltaproteobacteria bacterium]|nr:ATP-binding protein [Deltaproteobacteria bacterium]